MFVCSPRFELLKTKCTCMKFHEVILNGFQVLERIRILSQKLILTKGHNSKNIYPKVIVLALCTSSNVD